MKRKVFGFLCLVLLALIVLAGVASASSSTEKKQIWKKWDTIYLGHYEQDNILDEKDEAIEWYILEVIDDKALIVSTKVLDYKPYNTHFDATSWQTCSLREWLNSSFLNSAFTEEEQLCIQDTIITNGELEVASANSQFTSCSSTLDKIFLLDYSQASVFSEKSFSETAYATAFYNSHLSSSIKDGIQTRTCIQTKRWNAYVVNNSKNSFLSGCPVSTYCGICPAMWITLSESITSYHEAVTLAQEGNYEEAIRILDKIGSYADSVTKGAEYRLLYAKQINETNGIKEAGRLFYSYYYYVALNDVPFEYDEGMPSLTESIYYTALSYMSEQNYSDAIQLFSQISQYEDSMEQLLLCFEKKHTPYRWLTQNSGSAVNAGTSGYSKDDAITGSDPHFGWSLGRFLLSGYTEVDDSTGTPVFVKTQGDSLVLWFDLDQDIDKLNGNEQLKIADDVDGFDQRLGFDKTNMGRGALLLKHTDYRNSDSKPIAYLDYLEAKEYGIANTRVEIKEEGTYEVALDYEIRNSNIKATFSPVSNYRISFKFVVKNGSSMFFLFDLETGAELEDYSRTSNGFRIDLANSHSLQIDVVRYALNQSGTGLDVRSSAPAYDGEGFDRTGYYEITVENKETSAKLTKHLFVGSKGDLEEFQDADSSLSVFSK